METFLAFCARASAHTDYYDQLDQLARRVMAWEDIPRQAEKHGLGPLLYTHLQAAHIALPLPIKRELQGLYLRHRWANQVKTQPLITLAWIFMAGLAMRWPISGPKVGGGFGAIVSTLRQAVSYSNFTPIARQIEAILEESP